MKYRFKFRFWHKSKNRYINTEKLVLNDGTYTQVGTKQMNNGTYCSYIVNEYNTSEIIPEQCTGLKDRNQKLIYEGDILDFDLSTPKNGGHYRGFIRWQEQNELIGWMISDMDMSGDWDLRQIAHPNDWMVWGEIIGNIHENRELLEFNPEDYE